MAKKSQIGKTTKEKALTFVDPEGLVPGILNKIGLTKTKVGETLDKLLDAEEVKAQIPKGDHKFVYSKKLPALPIRLKAVELAARYHGLEPAEKHQVEVKPLIDLD